MAWPKTTDYHAAVQDPRISLGDEELRSGEVARTPLGLPMLWSGNFADVFKIHCPATGNTWALKCFTREVRGLRDRYRSIAAHLEQAQLPFTVDFQYLERGIRIGGEWFPVLKMRWVEGLTLNQFAEEHLERPANLKMLLDLWVKLAARLREAEVAHADLQHGNVLLVPMSGGSFALRLVDYDGMYVPALAGTRSGEVGHPAYQHPQRLREGTYSVEVDRFSHLAIYCGIRCLMLGRRELWQRFNNGDNLLFREEDFRNPGESKLFRILWKNVLDSDTRALVGRVVLACGTRLEEVPLLDEVATDGKVLPLTSEQEAAINAILVTGKTPAKFASEDDIPLEWLALPVGEKPAEQRLAALDTRTSHVTLTTADLPPPASSRLRAVGKSLLGSLTAAGRPLRRLVGKEHYILRYFFFLWVILPSLLFAAVWFWALTPSAGPLKLHPVAPRIVEAGKELTVAVSVDNAAAWKGKLEYRFSGKALPGASIDPQTGTLAWTPKRDQAPGKYDVDVSVETADGRRDTTTLRLTVTVPVPLKLMPVETQTVEAGKSLNVAAALENAEVWKGKVRFGLGPAAPLEARIDPQTGGLSWTPTSGQAPGKYDVCISVMGPDDCKDETTFVVNVLKPVTSLQLRPIAPRTVEVDLFDMTVLTVTVTPRDPETWKEKLRYGFAAQPPPGASIDPQSGEFSWMLPPNQAAGKYDVTVSAQGPEGQTAQTTFVITVTRPIAAPALTTLPGKEIAVDLGGGVKLELVLIPAGEFLMGSPDSDNTSRGEKPQHRVRITKPLYLGKYLVMQEQWQTVMGNNPSHFKGPKNPVERVSWDDCQQFFDKLNAKSRPGGGKFRLPTEAQWEYACRSGSTEKYCFGDDEAQLGEYAWYTKNAGGQTHPVGEKKPNAWGLYDMHGNVWEWCQDWYNGEYYAHSLADDPTGSATGSIRMLRGGGWGSAAGLCRSAGRNVYAPGVRDDDLGLRVSLVPADTDDVPRLAGSLKLQSVAPQIVEQRKLLSVTVTPENADAWRGKVRYGLGPQAPLGARIDSSSGEFSWTPPADQATGKYDVTVSAQGPDGQSAQTTFVVTVTRLIAAPALTTLLGKEISIDLGDGVKLEMVLVPAGKFLMGSPDSDSLASPSERPQHWVRITKPFYLGKCRVTQEQWEAVMGNNPSYHKGPKNPANAVRWDDCQRFVAKLNAKSGPGGGAFQLPTEAQWEYACRAGSTTRYCFGDDGSASKLGTYAWYQKNSGGMTHPVGKKKPNAWGLYDMHGSVSDWCNDWHALYTEAPVDDPVGPTTGPYHVTRGGTAGYCRSASRGRCLGGDERDYLSAAVGFRVSRSVE